VAIEVKGATYTDLKVGARPGGGGLAYKNVGAVVAVAERAGLARLEPLIAIKGLRR
jgi:hypothetical protein